MSHTSPTEQLLWDSSTNSQSNYLLALKTFIFCYGLPIKFLSVLLNDFLQFKLEVVMVRHTIDCSQALDLLCQDLHVYSYDICKVIKDFTVYGRTVERDSLYCRIQNLFSVERERLSRYASLEESEE